MQILVYKTNISHNFDVEKIRPLLSRHNNIMAWNVDIEDIDKVLRIEAKTDIAIEIADLIKNAGYQCGELE